MNLFEFLIKEDAIGDPEKRSAVARKILIGELKTTVVVYTSHLTFMDSSEVRVALQNGDKCVFDSIKIRRYRSAFEKMAVNGEFDPIVIKAVNVDESFVDFVRNDNIGRNLNLDKNRKEKIPGKCGRIAIIQIAIEIAWDIECETEKIATSKEVMKRLREMAQNGGCYSHVLKAPAAGKDAVIWGAHGGTESKEWTIRACDAALKKWIVSRNKHGISRAD